MRAAYIEQTGPPEVIQVGDLPGPNRGRARCWSGSARPAQPDRPVYPVGAGGDAAVVPLRHRLRPGRDGREGRARVARGSRSGDRVWGSNQGLLGRQGVAAEYAAVDEDWLYPTPALLPDTEAAAMALVGITAHLGLFQFGQLKAGETVYVPGGTGGVGSMVVQMAKAAGARVATAAGSPEKRRALPAPRRRPGSQLQDRRHPRAGSASSRPRASTSGTRPSASRTSRSPSPCSASAAA